MLSRNVSSKLRVLRQNDLGFLPASSSSSSSSSPFSTKAKDSSPAAASDLQNHIHGQARSFSSSSTTGAPPRKNSAPPPSPSSSSSSSSAPPGTDYVTLFQPSYGNALTGLGAYTPGSALKIYPLPRYVLKEDILKHLSGSSIQPDNVKFVYNATFRPDYVQFDVESASSQRQIMKRLQERGRLGCKFLRAEVSPAHPWTFVDASLKDAPRGRTLVMYNVGANTDFEDVERFFAGFDYDPSHVRFIKVSNEQAQNRGAQRRPISYHVAVGFTTKLEALRALREKSGDFCGNMSVNLRLIQ